VFHLRGPVPDESSTEDLILDFSQSVLIDFGEEFRYTSDIGEELGKGVELTRTVTERDKSYSLKNCLA
jgi:hypothetical protein